MCVVIGCYGFNGLNNVVLNWWVAGLSLGGHRQLGKQQLNACNLMQLTV